MPTYGKTKVYRQHGGRELTEEMIEDIDKIGDLAISPELKKLLEKEGFDSDHIIESAKDIAYQCSIKGQHGGGINSQYGGGIRCHAIAIIFLAAIATALTFGYNAGEAYLTDYLINSCKADLDAYNADRSGFFNDLFGTVAKMNNIPEDLRKKMWNSGYTSNTIVAFNSLQVATISLALYSVSSYKKMTQYIQDKGLC
jgi:hypothetical protein